MTEVDHTGHEVRTFPQFVGEECDRLGLTLSVSAFQRLPESTWEEAYNSTYTQSILVKPPSMIAGFVKMERCNHPSILAYAAYVASNLGLEAHFTPRPSRTTLPVGTKWVMISANCRRIVCELDSFDGRVARLHVVSSVNITTQEQRSLAPFLRTTQGYNTVPIGLRIASPVVATLMEGGRMLKLTHIGGVEVGNLEITPLSQLQE